MSDKFEVGIKFDSGKTEYGLIPPLAFKLTADVMTFGAKKYSANNWIHVKPKIRYFNAAMRHMWVWFSGEKNDPESGIHHLAHAICCLMMLLEHDEIHSKDDDNFGNPKKVN